MAKKESGNSTGAEPPVQRQIAARTICFSEESAPMGGGNRFAVCVTCIAKHSLVFCRRGQRPYVRRHMHDGGNTMTTFPVADLTVLQTDDGCHRTLRGMLTQLPQLRSLHLAQDEWDAVVPKDVVPEIVGAATRLGDDNDGFTFSLTMVVRRRVIHDERALLMACKERPAAAAAEQDLHGEIDDCAICLDGLEGERAVELPACEHAFHRRCVSKWFAKATTCPMCRGDVRQCRKRGMVARPSIPIHCPGFGVGNGGRYGMIQSGNAFPKISRSTRSQLPIDLGTPPDSAPIYLYKYSQSLRSDRMVSASVRTQSAGC